MGVVGHIGESMSRWIRGILNLESWIGGPSREERSIVHAHICMYSKVLCIHKKNSREEENQTTRRHYNNIITRPRRMKIPIVFEIEKGPRGSA